MREFDTLILGGGCVGAAIFHELALFGQPRVGLVDQGRKSRSATARSGGMLRIFHEGLPHLQLAAENHRILREYEAAGWVPRAGTNGSLYFFHRRRLRGWQENLAALERARIPFAVLTPAEGRFPEFRWEREEMALFEPEGGSADPAAFTESLLRHGRNLGGETLEEARVERIRAAPGGYYLATSDGCLRTRQLVLAGGAAMLPRLEDLGLRLPLTARELNVHESTKEGPGLPNYFDRESLEYGRLGAGRAALLSSLHPQRIELDFAPARTLAAQDCYAPGRLGLAGLVPGHPGLFLAAGWGGTAFKFSLAIGRQISGLVAREGTKGTRYAV